MLRRGDTAADTTSRVLDRSWLYTAITRATQVGRLWHIGASTHPGAGLGGGSGHLVATTLTRRRAWRR
jgi:phytoene dehydrogenase-like protein